MDWLQPGPDIQTKIVPDKKVAGSVWLPGPKVCSAGNLKEVGQIVPDSVRFLLCLQKETESGVVWLNLASFPSIFLQIFGPGNQIEPAIF